MFGGQHHKIAPKLKHTENVIYEHNMIYTAKPRRKAVTKGIDNYEFEKKGHSSDFIFLGYPIPNFVP
jgi:hypothetical protein